MSTSPKVPPTPCSPSSRARWLDGGQSTAEYALVLVVAATIAMLALSWAASTNRVGSLFDLVFRSVSGLLA